MLMISPRRFILTLLVGITAAIIGMIYHRTVLGTTTSTLKIFSQSLATNRLLPSYMMGSPKPPPPVIIVGSGLAGLSAAHEALRAGARVHLLERAAKPGGNSIKASSGINGAGTRFQKAAGVEVDDKFYDDTVRSAGRRFRQSQAPAQAQTTTENNKNSSEEGVGHAGENVNINRTALIDTLTTRSESAVHWLTDEIGIDLSVVAPLGGHSLPRTHRGAGSTPPGFAIISTLLKQLNANANFELTTSAHVVSLEVDDNDDSGAVVVVVGLKYDVASSTDDGMTVTQTQHELQGPVVFAAGGFAGDADGLLAKYRPDLAGMPSTNDANPASHGLLEAVGAHFVDMDSVQVHPTGFVDSKDPSATYKFLAAEVLRGEGGILLSGGEGKRFVNEMETREVVSKAIMEDLSPSQDSATRQWDVTLLLDPGTIEATAGHLGFYLFKGLMEKKKVKDLSPQEIEAVDWYAAAVASATDAEFGRRTFGHWRLLPGEANREEEVCVGKVTPITHFTMGGAAFNERAQVLGRQSKGLGRDLVPIEGLWAAGEITGGIHGDNRLGGSSLLECVVFGRIAGAEAAKKATAVAQE